ncbi:MAG: ABC transporter ATP-binding protein [Alphaproteobacteria bacterium]|nr:ABC transporter ATP-binding protein [Alphaproteobacteria bacterium]
MMPVIHLENLSFSYPTGVPALRKINLSIKAGEKVCLAGPNGAGKSTLLLCLAGLLKAQGTLRVGVRAPRKGFPSVGLVFQDPEDQLFCSTVGEDVAFGPRNQGLSEEKVRQRVTDSLACVGLRGFEGRNPYHLSGGEKKRAALAATLACQMEILALDEPWANLDARAARAVTGILQGFPGTLLLASHDLRQAAKVCDRLVVIEDGTIAADQEMAKLGADIVFLEAHGLA